MIVSVRSLALPFLCFCLAAVMCAQAQPSGASATTYSFDVVSIKPHAAGDNSTRIDTRRDHFSAANISLRDLLVYAYDLKTEDQVSGLPKPLDQARFDVEAKMDADTTAALTKLSREEFRKQQQSMFVALLEDRFQLKAHTERREQPVYALVIAKNGLKLKHADPNDTYPNGVKGPDGKSHAGTSMLQNGDWKAQGISIEFMIGTLERQPDVHRVVVDKTGLTGTYDFELTWKDSDTPGSGDNGAAEAGPSLFAALEEQLGLKLEPTRGSVDAVVVDHVTAPSEN